MQAAGCALSWCYPIKKFRVKSKNEGVKVFVLKNCWNRFSVRNLLPAIAKPAKQLVHSC